MSITAVVPEAEAERGLVRAFVIGSIVGFVAVFVVFAGVTFGVGMGLGAAIGVGIFTACWGGPGFGGMMGAVLHHSKADES